MIIVSMNIVMAYVSLPLPPSLSISYCFIAKQQPDYNIKAPPMHATSSASNDFAHNSGHTRTLQAVGPPYHAIDSAAVDRSLAHGPNAGSYDIVSALRRLSQTPFPSVTTTIMYRAAFLLQSTAPHTRCHRDSLLTATGMTLYMNRVLTYVWLALQ